MSDQPTRERDTIPLESISTQYMYLYIVYIDVMRTIGNIQALAGIHACTSAHEQNQRLTNTGMSQPFREFRWLGSGNAVWSSV